MSIRHTYSEKERRFCLDNIKRFDSYKDFAEAFNKYFGTEISESKLKDLCCKRLKKGIGKSKTCFKNGSRARALPIGTIRKASYGKYIKVSDTLTGVSGYKKPDWLPLQKKLYQDVYGAIPENKMVIFLDCDRSNFSIENLYCIDRCVSMELAKNRWYSTDRNITLAAIKYCELRQALKARSVKKSDYNSENC